MSKSILLVEDEMLSTFIAKRIIEIVDKEQQVATAEDGKKALQWLSENYRLNSKIPDVIILDLQMPVMGGFEFLREFRKLNFGDQSARIFVMSSSNDFKDEQEAMSLGATGFVPKPLTEDLIRKIIV